MSEKLQGEAPQEELSKPDIWLKYETLKSGLTELIEKWEKEIAQYTIDPSWVDDEWLLKAQQLIQDLKRLVNNSQS